MRCIIQRVSEASVQVGATIKGKIGKGLFILLGVEENDNDEDVIWLSRKIVNLRIFNDQQDLMNLSLSDTCGELLVVSQFTLFASTKKGNRPSFILAAKPDKAAALYELFLKQLELESGRSVQKGVFGAHMKVSIINDGPVTLFIDTKNKE